MRVLLGVITFLVLGFDNLQAYDLSFEKNFLTQKEQKKIKYYLSQEYKEKLMTEPISKKASFRLATLNQAFKRETAKEFNGILKKSRKKFFSWIPDKAQLMHTVDKIKRREEKHYD